MRIMRSMADAYAPGSLSNRLRSRRFSHFEGLATKISTRPLRIVDIGGTNAFWENRGWAGRTDVEITTINLTAEPKRHANITPVSGEATNLSGIRDGEYDIAFSNSVIEHLFTYENQAAMAREVQSTLR